MPENKCNFYTIDNIGQGFLAIMPQPGLPRDLATQIGLLARHDVQQVVSLLGPDEVELLGLQDEAKLVEAESMRFLSLPITDLGLPTAINDFARLSLRLFQQVETGINTVIHCRAGIGRSGLLAAAVLVHGGRDVPQAFAQVSRGRGRSVPETVAQGDWLLANLASLKASADTAAMR
jgi:protein-tyrosine phosphatase